MENEKREKFVELAEARTKRILKSLELLGNLSNTSHYEYTAEQVDKIFSAIQSSVTRQKRKFQGNMQKEKKFKL